MARATITKCYCDRCGTEITNQIPPEGQSATDSIGSVTVKVTLWGQGDDKGKAPTNIEWKELCDQCQFLMRMVFEPNKHRVPPTMSAGRDAALYFKKLCTTPPGNSKEAAARAVCWRAYVLLGGKADL